MPTTSQKEFDKMVKISEERANEKEILSRKIAMMDSLAKITKIEEGN